MPRSAELLTRAEAVIPGGVNSPVRAFGPVGGLPPFIARGEGTWLVDVDGHRYVDMIASWGALLSGHAHPDVVAAVTDAMSRGSSFGAPTEAEILLAEAVVSMVPSIQKVRACSSGTESTMHAIRLARGFTGRERVLKLDGCYHGAHDGMLVAAGSGVATLGIPGSPGVPAGTAAATTVVAYNDLAAARAALAAHPGEFAAVILEPVAGNMGLIAPAPGYLQGLRDLCTETGTVLIFDEVMTGFRIARGGAQERFGVMPDLTCLGKVVGGGFPMAVFGGRADIMDKIAPTGPVYQAGTLSGNPVAVAAGLASLAMATPETYEALEAIGARIEAEVGGHAIANGQSFARVGGMFTVFFRSAAPTNFAEARTSDTVAFATYQQTALKHGVYLPPSQYEACFYSRDLGGDALDQAIAGMKAGIDAAVAR